MAPGAAFEFGGGSPGSILPLRRQCWCAAAPRPHFPRPIRPEPPSSPPSSALTEPCMPLSGTANGAGTAADGTERALSARRASPPPPPLPLPPSPAAMPLLFRRFCECSICRQPLRARHRPKYGRWAAQAAPGRRRAARPRPGGGLGACRCRWAQQRRLLGAAVRFRSRLWTLSTCSVFMVWPRWRRGRRSSGRCREGWCSTSPRSPPGSDG